MRAANVYRQPRKGPIHVGQLRSMAWRAVLPPVVAQDDPQWTARCKEYWQLQERLYGLRMSDFTMIIDADEGVVVTFSTVLDVLPGERTLDYDRVPAARVQ